ncbi:MAG TPA: PQQ-binding-like beta-propeller repeat protein [Mobilitalea sp.]|nr:PQQ-binding-like beta-propeller repeat protein [Mobilitalea sp.]
MKQVFKRFILTAVICLMLVPATACSKKSSDDASDNQLTPDNETKTDKDTTGVIEAAEQAEEGSEAVLNEAGAIEESEEVALNPEVAADGSWKFKTGSGVASSPMIIENTIYFGSKDGNFYALDKKTGKELWKYNSGNPILCQAAALDNAVFFCSKEIYFAVDARTGAEIWKYDLKPKENFYLRKDNWDYHDASPVVDNGVVYFGSSTGSLLGFDAVSGELVWEFKAPGSNGVRSTPLIQDGVMYYGDWAGEYRAINMETKEIVWNNSYYVVFQNSAVIKDGVIFIGGRNKTISALDIKTGEAKWDYKDPDDSWITGDPVIDGDIVYFSTSDSLKVYALNINDGTVAAEYPIYKNSFSKVIIDNGLLYVTSGDAYSQPGSGSLQVYKLGDTSECVWKVMLGTGGIFTSPLLSDELVYYGSEDGNLYATVVK